MRKENKEIKLSERILFRLTEDEFKELRQKAKERGTSISRTVRYLILKKGSDAADSKNNRLAELRAIKRELASAARNFSLLVDNYLNTVEMKDTLGQPLVSTQSTIRVVRSLEALMIKVQQCINSYHVDEGVREDYPVVARPELRRLEEKLGQKPASAEMFARIEKIKYFFMENISIIGRVGEKPSVYNRNGADRLMLVVRAESRSGDSVFSRKYIVYSNNTDLAELLDEGIPVFVCGRFGQNGSGDPLVFADQIKVLPECVSGSDIESIVIIGAVSGEPELISGKDGAPQKLKFCVEVKSVARGNELVRTYTVLSSKMALKDNLKNGCGVFVTGRYGQKRDGGPVVFADSINIYGAVEEERS